SCRRGRFGPYAAAKCRAVSSLLLTGGGACGNGARHASEITSELRSHRGETRMGHQAHLPELRRALLRFDARPDRLPEMRDAVRSRSLSEIAPNAARRTGREEIGRASCRER